MLAEHQRDAVTRALAMLRMHRGVVLADEVGLGKSFIAAEVMRMTSGECELIVPAALVAQWRETLARFGVAASMLTHDGIVNAGFLPRPRERLVVVDEAHAFRNPATRRFAALAQRTIAARVLLITATPVCNSLRDLEALLRLAFRDDVLAAAGVPSLDAAFVARDRETIERVVAALVIRRDRSVLPDALQFGTLDRRVVLHPVLRLPSIETLRFPLTGHAPLLRRFLRRRLESSEAALAESIRRQLRFYERALACIAAGRTLPKREYRVAFGHEEDRAAFQEVLFWELFAPAGDTDPVVVRDEVSRLETLLGELHESPQIKRGMLVDLVQNECEPMLIFTGSAATARDLYEALRSIRRCGLVTARERSRDAVLHAFRSGRIDVVISTDMAAEGLNLQRAGVVVHYDIPWNPVKLDQRNGRAYRIGQERDEVRAVYFVPLSRETKIVQTVARKNRMRRRIFSPPHPACEPAQRVAPTARPRLARDAAYLQLAARTELPDILARRHKAGIENLIAEMSREYLDQRRVDDLVALVRCELA